MLRQLYIRNFTLIDTLDIDFCSGFSVITGETGAGKSIILGAIGLLLGQRADTKLIKQGAEKCIIEAHFDLSEYGIEEFFNDNDIEYDADDCIIRRELTATGKSRAFINDTPTPLSVLKDLGDRLIDIHSQHQNLLLSKHDFQLNMIDIIAADKNELAEYQKAFDGYVEKQKQLKQHEEDVERNRINMDFIKYQFDELDNAKLTEGEQDELEARQDAMTHAEDIKSSLYEANYLISANDECVLSMVKSAIQSLGKITNILPACNELHQRLESCHIELKDISYDIDSLLEKVNFDPSELEAISNRLDLIYSLERKHHCNSVEELISIRDNLKSQLANIENSDEITEQLRKELQQLQSECQKKAEVISRMRHKAAKSIETEMHDRLQLLGMPNVYFNISITKEDIGRNGCDKVSFLFSANKNNAPQPISQVASGGEIARVMLSLKAMISNAVKLPTIIFDEIDTGVSGKIAEQMARLMCEMGKGGRQVISITHLPQIAALGETHYKVRKEDTSSSTISTMQKLNTEERIKEIAQMLSGSDISDAAISNAKELLRL